MEDRNSVLINAEFFFDTLIGYISGKSNMMKSCVTGKKSYPNQFIAEQALIEAQAHYDYGRASGPVAVYRCEECGNFHLTSKGPINEKLAEAIKKGKLKALKEENQWTDKFRRR